MEILIYLVPAGLGIALWMVISEFLNKSLSRKMDEVSRIKKTSRKPHSYEDHNKRYRKPTESTITFWKADKMDLETEKRLKHRVELKVKGKVDER